MAALREGGFVIFLRHAETEFDDGDDPGHTEDFSDCSLQRNLNDAGREGARQQGEDLRALEVPVDEVLASPYCRTLQSAELTFGPEAVRVVEELATVRYLSRDDPEYEQRLELLREIFATPPPEGTNTVVMTHELNLRLVAEITVPQGGAVVFEPDAQGGEEFEIFATLPPEWWEREASGNAGTG